MDNNSYDKLIDRIIDKRYKIESVVGVGGMSYVLRALDLTTGRDVAVKILSDEFKDDERAVKRFINESKTVSMLDHENIVKILDVVITDEFKYIVMEFIDGITLKDYIDRIGVLAWKEAVYYTKQILRALSHAHEKQIIHRDIKPQNIMLLSDGTVKVTDFGIAKHPNAEAITMTDKAIGTVNYISPEQAGGTKIDVRSDIYSTSVMLYEMVTGRLPFIADSPVAVAMMQVSNDPVPPRELNDRIPIGLEQIILKAMQKDPDNRFAGAAAMLKALDYFTENPSVVFAGASQSTGGSISKEQTDAYEEEKKNREKRKKYVRGSRSMFPIIAGIATSFAVVAVVFVIVWVLPFFKGAGEGDDALDRLESGFATAVDRMLGMDGVNDESKKVTVASLIDKEYGDELVEEMKTLGLSVETVNYVRNPSYEAGRVVRQEPEEGAVRLRSEATGLVPMTLYVNMGQKEMRMPDCTLLSESDAKTRLRAEYKTASSETLTADAITVVQEFHETYPSGYVIRTEPEAGALISSENAVFTLYVSQGLELKHTSVPDVVGLETEHAKKSILTAKLALGEIHYEESDLAPGTVLRTQPTAGETVVEEATAVELWVSIARPEESTITEQPTVEPETPSAAHGTDEAGSGSNAAQENESADTGTVAPTEPETPPDSATNTDTEVDPDTNESNASNTSDASDTSNTSVEGLSTDLSNLLNMRDAE